MKAATEKMREKLNAGHDWEDGQVYGGGGTRLSSTDVCSVCGLRRHWFSDTQNGVEDHYRYSDAETGADLTLRQAISRGCGV